ncbi:MAG TPA: hypothetical protein V6D33_13575 [Cyanophyceae cyanobacterium]
MTIRSKDEMANSAWEGFSWLIQHEKEAAFTPPDMGVAAAW